MIDIKDIYWLAGWLEGEGCFNLSRDGEFKQFRIEYSSTDLDAIQKVNKLLNTDQKIFIRKQTYSKIGNKNKPEYYTKIAGTHAISWMMTLYPLMGNRRRSKIKEIISIWKSYRNNGSGLCRRCGSKLVITIQKRGWNKGKRNSYCRSCRIKRTRVKELAIA